MDNISERTKDLFTELWNYQKALKSDFQWSRIYQIQVRETQEQIQQLHFDYYEQLLLYDHEFQCFSANFNIENFIKSKKKQEPEPEYKYIRKKSLQRNIGIQFGSKAPEKLQRLLFMLRENSDVLQVFIENILNYVFENDVELVCPIIHSMFQDLTAADTNQRIVYVVYALTMRSFPGEIVEANNDEELKREFERKNAYSRFRDQMFTEMTKTLEAKQCAQSIFLQKFERLDMEFLSQSNIYQLHVDKMMKSIQKAQESESNINVSGAVFDNIESESGSTSARNYDEMGKSSYEKKSNKSSGNLNTIVKYITDSIEAFIDQICQRVPSIPSTIRVFCKALYDTIYKDTHLSKIGAYRLICQHIIEQWLAKTAFENTVVNGLAKTYYIQSNALQNMKLMSYVMNKIFRLDDSPFEDDVLQLFNNLYDKKKNKILEFYRELIEIPDSKDMSLDRVFIQEKFQHHSMCLSLENVNHIYQFFKQHKDKFTTSKQSINVLTNDIDYMHKEQKILQVKDPEPANIEYYMFYKSIDKSNKSEKQEPQDDQEEESDLILKKNVRIMLQEIDDLGAIERSIQAKNNILDIRRCILQTLEKNRINKGSQNYSIDLILESLVIKYKCLDYNNSSLKSFVNNIASDFYQNQQALKTNREFNLSMLIDMKDWLKVHRIPNLHRERTQVDWLFKINVKLATFIKSPKFNDIHFWRFEDECMYLHMDLTEENSESTYWKEKVQEKIEWRAEFFTHFRELLPPSILKEVEKQENESPKKISMTKNKSALEGNPALKFMLPKQNRSQIIKEDGAEAEKSTDVHEKYGLTPEQYEKFLNMPAESKEAQYQQMGFPTIKRKKLHFKSIEFFAVCILKYFNPVVGRVLSEENEDYSGLMTALNKFMERIQEKLELEDWGPRLIVNDEENYQQDLINDYLQEINDFIVNGLHKALFQQNFKSQAEQSFNQKYSQLRDSVPQDFGIPDNYITEQNMPMWQKAIKELQKIAKQKTPSLKLKYLLNSFMIANNAFSLFSSIKENQAASADDILLIFPYLVVKAEIDKLYQQIKFIKMFQCKELLNGEQAYVSNKLEITAKIIMQMNAKSQQQ